MTTEARAAAQPLPIGVVLPTLNAMNLLPGHLQSMRSWLDRVAEIVVVDSESSDGTAEYLKRELPADRLRFHTRPRGLYQSWNSAIGRVESQYTYISTVGDAITPEGLEHLYGVAEALRADVVVSPPAFISESGEPVAPLSWPPHRLISILGIDEPVLLNRWTAFGFSFISIAQAILGSSASNLYRTEVLQQRPFPTDYGTAGDCAWGLAHSLFVDIALTPRCFSTFREHEKSYAARDYAVEDMHQRLDEVAEAAFARALAADDRLRESREAQTIDAMIRQRALARDWQRALKARRRRAWPWVLNPAAWRARARRDRARAEFEGLALALLTQEGRRAEAVAVLTSKPWLKWASSR